MKLTAAGYVPYTAADQALIAAHSKRIAADFPELVLPPKQRSIIKYVYTTLGQSVVFDTNEQVQEFNKLHHDEDVAACMSWATRLGLTIVE